MSKLLMMAALAAVLCAGCGDDEDDDNPTPGSDCNSAALVFTNSGDTVVLPNAFTPNGDGLNDRLYLLHGTNDSLSGSLTVYQQGNQIFATDQINYASWNGTNSSGVVLPEGTFQVRLKLNLDDGGTYEDTRCVRLINPGVSGCIDTSMYRFEDQYGINGNGGVQTFQTGEVACP